MLSQLLKGLLAVLALALAAVDMTTHAIVSLLFVLAIQLDQIFNRVVPPRRELKVFHSTVAPADPIVGDMWVDTSTPGYLVRTWEGDMWINVRTD